MKAFSLASAENGCVCVFVQKRSKFYERREMKEILVSSRLRLKVVFFFSSRVVGIKKRTR